MNLDDAIRILGESIRLDGRKECDMAYIYMVERLSSPI